jgi:hypothetical protein
MKLNPDAIKNIIFELKIFASGNSAAIFFFHFNPRAKTESL